MFPSGSVIIDEVFIDDSLGLCIVPRIPSAQNFQHIYRAANSVRWNEERRMLHMVPVPEWSRFDQFGSIMTALALEYGVKLLVDSRTRWTGISTELRGQIEALG